MVLPATFGGWIALGISLALWAFIIGSVVLIAREEFREEKKKPELEVKKEKKNSKS